MLKTGERRSFESERSRSRIWHAPLFFILIFALAFVIYAPAISGQWIWDDEFLVVKNTFIRDIRFLPDIFRSHIGEGAGIKYLPYRPLQIFSYLIDYHLWNGNFAGLHITNILLHISVTALFYALMRRLMMPARAAGIGALLYLVHPVHTEAVSYVSGRADILAAAFMLSSFLCYLQTEFRPRRFIWGGSGAVLFLAALLTREGSVILPALMLVFHGIFRKPLYKRIFALYCLAFGGYFVARWLLYPPVSFSAEGSTLWERLPGALAAVGQYVRILLLPLDLHMEYGRRIFVWFDARVWAGILIVAAGGVAGKFFLERKPLICFGLVFFGVSLLPVLNLIPLNAFMAEHWLYQPSQGLFLVAGLALNDIGYRLTRDSSGRIANFATIVMIIILVFFYGNLTRWQNRYWQDPEAFYARTLEYAPDSARLYYNWANWRTTHNFLQRPTVALYKRAIALDPHNADFYQNLGHLYWLRGEPEFATASLKMALAIDDDRAAIYLTLTEIALAEGHLAQARRFYQEARKRGKSRPILDAMLSPQSSQAMKAVAE